MLALRVTEQHRMVRAGAEMRNQAKFAPGERKRASIMGQGLLVIR